jgi:hypothetical protein
LGKRRHATEIERKKAVKFNSKCDDWCTKENFAEMYDDTCKTMVRVGVAMKLLRPVFQDKGGIHSIIG